MQKNPEILSPAGSPEALDAALKNGATAVYIGGKSFSARANARNFDLGEIESSAKKCHLYGAKLHLAVNTVVFDDEIPKLRKYLYETANSGVDCYIVQDGSVLEILKSISKDIPVHASTQMSVHSLNGALQVKKMGFSRVVAARELSFDEIKNICQNSGIETEIFVHGALCMCLSGQCFMSAMIGGRSANRGMCAQSCRLPFSANGKTHYALSLKDLSIVKYLNQLVDVGVDSFKIEGRRKSPEYVAAATRAVHDALNGKKPDMELLRNIFSRSGFTDGYLTAKRENMYGTRRDSDAAISKSAEEKIRKYPEIKPFKISFKGNFEKYKPAYLEAIDSNGLKAEIYGSIIEAAKSVGTSKEKIENSLKKLGNSLYNFENADIYVENGSFIPISQINEMRRNLCESLDKTRIKNNFPKRKLNDPDNRYLDLENIEYDYKISEKYFRVRIRTHEQFLAVRSFAESGKIKCEIPIDIALNETIKNKENFYIIPSVYISDEKRIISKLREIKKAGFENLVCPNISYIKSGGDLSYNLHGDFRLNITNSISLRYFSRILNSQILSPEMKFSEMRKMHIPSKSGVIIYGRLPLMVTRTCPIKNQLGNCKNCPHTLSDRTSREFPVYCENSKDYFVIYNADKLMIKADCKDIPKNINSFELIFSDENKIETEKILRSFLNNEDINIKNATHGLYYRGVTR